MTIKYNHTTIHYTDNGSGTPVILLHGFLETLTIWHTIVTAFTATHRVICIDLLGHGNTGSLKDENTHSMEQHAKIVSLVADHLNISKAIIIGHSMGGYVALAIAELYPELIHGLCLINSTSRADSKHRKKSRDRSIGVIQRHHKTYAGMAISNLFCVETRERFMQDIETLKQNAYTITPENMIASVLGMKNRKDRSTTLSAFKGKKLMITGEKDTILPLSCIKEECQDTQTDCIILSGGHMSYMEDKKTLLQTLKEFLL